MDPEFEPARCIYRKPAESVTPPVVVHVIDEEAPSDSHSLPEILPGIRPRTRQRIVSTLRLTGLVKPMPGGVLTFSSTDAATIRKYAGLIREGGLTIHDALSVIRGVLAEPIVDVSTEAATTSVIASVSSAPALLTEEVSSIAESVEPETPVISLVEDAAPPPALEEVTQELEALRKIKQDAERREAEFIAEMSRLKGAIERFRSETASQRAESAEIIRDLDEERRNARARIARLEALTRTKPRGFWGRVRAAVGVLFGRSAAILALPAPRPTSQQVDASTLSASEQPLRRAA